VQCAPSAALLSSCTSILDNLSRLERSQSASMPALALSREVFDVLSKSLGFVPIIGENLKSAAELASKICEEIQVREHLLSCTSRERIIFVFV
jgi:hypothetical protein